MLSQVGRVFTVEAKVVGCVEATIICTQTVESCSLFSLPLQVKRTGKRIQLRPDGLDASLEDVHSETTDAVDLCDALIQRLWIFRGGLL